MDYARFFDTAASTRCCDAALKALHRYSDEAYAHPSSAHWMGLEAAEGIAEARAFLAETFGVPPAQVLFTSGGTEADNLAIYGVVGAEIARRIGASAPNQPPPRVLYSSIEHPAVQAPVESLATLGFDPRIIPVDQDGIPQQDAYGSLLTQQTALVSIMGVNNITGAILPIERLAAQAKAAAPGCVFHTDAVAAFTKVEMPKAGGPVDLISISAHKIGGPKGVGALIALNAGVLDRARFRPMFWGGGQEGGLRGGTQNAGLIAAFAEAVRDTLAHHETGHRKVKELHHRFRRLLSEKGLLHPSPERTRVDGRIRWLSPEAAISQIMSISIPGIGSADMAKRLEDRGCLVATGSACTSGKKEPDRVLTALGFSEELASCGIRISLSPSLEVDDIDYLANAIEIALTQPA